MFRVRRPVDLNACWVAAGVNKIPYIYQLFMCVNLKPLTGAKVPVEVANRGFGGSAGRKEWYESGHLDLPNRR